MLGARPEPLNLSLLSQLPLALAPSAPPARAGSCLGARRLVLSRWAMAAFGPPATYWGGYQALELHRPRSALRHGEQNKSPYRSVRGRMSVWRMSMV
jgi:hypothetical protein